MGSMKQALMISFGRTPPSGKLLLPVIVFAHCVSPISFISGMSASNPLYDTRTGVQSFSACIFLTEGCPMQVQGAVSACAHRCEW